MTRYLTTAQREFKACKHHICMMCGASFSCKTKCWYHMDNYCSKKEAPREEWYITTLSATEAKP